MTSNPTPTPTPNYPLLASFGMFLELLVQNSHPLSYDPLQTHVCIATSSESVPLCRNTSESV